LLANACWLLAHALNRAREIKREMPAVRLNGPAGIAGYRVEVDGGWAAVQHA